MIQTFEDRISAAQLRLRINHPFFATLALFAKIEVSENIETAATDGKSLFFNETYIASLSNDEFDGLMIHEILHMALLHVNRKQSRDSYRWNYACDIVVNGMITNIGLSLPSGALRDLDLEKLSAEEIYDRLPEDIHSFNKINVDLLPSDMDSVLSDLNKQKTKLDTYWNNAREQASIVLEKLIESGKYNGNHPLGMNREWQTVKEPEIDWRTTLWKYMVSTPVDYAGFDRRFVGKGIYLDSLYEETVNIAICVDTSASIDNSELKQFSSEIRSILNSYPHLFCDLYFADSELYGPYDISNIDDIPIAKGGGGTSFSPFFSVLSKSDELERATSKYVMAIYFTDGFANFPSEPDLPVLWVITKCGLSPSYFPFGVVTRLT